MKATISQAEAARLALAAQGFSHQPRAEKASWAKLAAAIERMHVLQIDSVNVLVRSHYLPLFARVGAYDRTLLDARTLLAKNRQCFECWAHEASLVPIGLHPLMRWRMNRALNGNGTYRSMSQFALREKTFLKSTLDFIRKNGATTASAIPGSGKGEGGWWGWSRGKMTMETLFDQGLVTTSCRDGFERIYDLPERVIPAEVLNLPTPPEDEAFRQLIVLAATALGIGTETDLRDYFRLPVAEARRAIAELAAEGILQEITVPEWKAKGFALPNAKLPRKAGGTALLSPFDPLTWNRDRAERLFNFHYRIEIYTPAHKRKFGYYVLPLLLGETIAGRVCLKADREAETLRANAIHVEDMADHGETAAAFASEIKLMAKWLGLPNIEISKKGNLAPALRKLF